MESANRTLAFLADESAWPAVNIELRDVQGLWGGRRILVSGTGHTVVQVVSARMHEQRYEVEIGDNRVRRLLAMCVENDFATIKPDERLGIPDEARPGNTLVNAAGDRCTISKWAGVEDTRFDAIYAEHLRIEALIQYLTPTYCRPFEQEYTMRLSPLARGGAGH